MKKTYLLFAFIAIAIYAHSQNVIRGEYFIDTDPGFGQATTFTISTPDSDITQAINIPYSAFSNPGYHFLFIRTLDANGIWSLTARKIVEVDDNISSLNVIKVEYFFATDNSVGGDSFIQLNASTDSTWSFNIPSNQVPGTWTDNDTLFIRVQDSVTGMWSLTTLVDSANASCFLPDTPANTTATGALTIDSGTSTALTATGTGTLSWYNAGSGGTYLGTGASFTTPVLTVTTTFYVQDSTCGPSSRRAITVTVNSTSGIAIINGGGNFGIYPNPTKGSFVVQTTATEKQLLQVFDIAGKLMITQPIQNGQTTIDAGNLAPGIYIVSLKDNVATTNQKLVITR